MAKFTAIWALFLISAAAAASSPDCGDVVDNMVDCLDFVIEGSPQAKPTKSCCDGVKTVVAASPKCLCEALEEAVDGGYNVNMTRADGLPASCSLKVSSNNCPAPPSPAPAPHVPAPAPHTPAPAPAPNKPSPVPSPSPSPSPSQPPAPVPTPVVPAPAPSPSTPPAPVPVPAPVPAPSPPSPPAPVPMPMPSPPTVPPQPSTPPAASPTEPPAPEAPAAAPSGSIKLVTSLSIPFSMVIALLPYWLA